jgi:hypothetical protein
MLELWTGGTLVITMNDSIRFYSRVGDDGVLNVQLNLGQAEARKDVVITIKPLMDADHKNARTPSMSWSDFIDRTYGACAGQELERPAQGEYESREPLE